MGFAVNHWGYKLPSDGMWKPFDPAGTQVGYSDSAATDKEEVISFAAKVNSIPPTGTYKLSVVLTAVANSKPVGIEDVVYMQDFAEASDADKSSILASMTEGTSYTIKDSRDEQDYTVAKLFDGNIWMTKNLDLAGGTTLTPDKSNVTSNYTLPASSLSGWGDSAAPAAYVYNSNSSSCVNASNTPVACYSYYSFVAATAGTNPSSGNATSDICPAGWRLPTAEEADVLVGEFNTREKITSAPFMGVNNTIIANGKHSSSSGTGAFHTSSIMAGASSNQSNIFVAWNPTTQPRVMQTSADLRSKNRGYGVRCIVK